jgi:hypothetical protein
VRVTADGTIRNVTDTFGGEPLADLAITAQLDHVAADPHPYGWRTEYRQPYAVDRAAPIPWSGSCARSTVA